MTRCLRILLAALTLAGAAAPPPAHAVDPRLEWRTMETDHFRVHFPDGGYPLALQAANYLEAAHARLAPLLGHTPRRKTEVILTDDVDAANGSATSIPYPRIAGFMSPPARGSVLDYYDDWLWLLLVHEYVHVLHLDTVGGIPALGNRIFGHLFGPNFLQPDWVTEGLATRYESALTGRGRNYSPRVDAWLRAQVLEEGALWPLDKVSGRPVDWPGGSHWYTYGGRLWQAVMAERGEGAAARISLDYGGRLLPFALDLSSEEAVSLALTHAFERWRAGETERHLERLASIREAGVREGRRVTRLGRRVDAPRWSPDCEVLYAHVASGEAWPAIRRIDPAPARPARLADTEVVRRANGKGAFAVGPRGDLLVYVKSEVFQQEQVYDDLWAAPLEGGEAVRLTEGMRARDPTLSPDGRRLAFVAGRRGEMALYVMAFEAWRSGASLQAAVGRPVRVFRRPGMQLDRPAFAADGRTLAVGVHRGAQGRDVALVPLHDLDLPDADRVLGPDGPLRVPEGASRPVVTPDAPGTPGDALWVTRDPAEDGDPAFSPDGRWLLFSSARDGVFDVYAQPLGDDGRPTGGLRRITRTRTAALQPRVDPAGRRLAYVTVTSEGHDLAVMAFDPAAAPLAPPPPEVGTVVLTSAAEAGTSEAGASGAGAAVPEAPPEPGPPRLARAWPVGPYRPWGTLRPWWWLPDVFEDAEGLALGLTTRGEDIVGRHAWQASAWYGLASAEPGWRLAYGYRGFFPRLDASTARSLVAGRARVNGGTVGFSEISWRAGLGATFPRPGVERSQALSLGVSVDHRQPRSLLEAPDPTAPRPELPEPGTATRLSAAWSASSVHRFAESISAEEGVGGFVSASLGTRLLGGDFDFLQLRSGVAGYLALPLPLHVLALNLDLGAGVGDFGGRNLFVIGGLPLTDPVLAAWRGTGFGGPTLRGYPPSAFGGDAFAVANVEWRFPLLDPQRGLGAMPVFLRRLHGAAFVDTGFVSDVPVRFDPAELKVGVGGELRAEVEVGYQLRFLVRAGWAEGLSEGADSGPFVVLGSSF